MAATHEIYYFNCDFDQKMIVSQVKTVFSGLRMKVTEYDDDPAATVDQSLIQFPVLETWKDEVFFSFGLDFMYRGYLFPAYYIPSLDGSASR